MSVVRAIAITLVLSVAAAALGAWGSARYLVQRMEHAPSLHQMIHDELNLAAEQERRIEGMERDYAAKRQALEAEMRAANAELAQALLEQHTYTPKVQAAIDRFHRAMGELQKESVQHVIGMRTVLTPEQAAKFDDTVVKSLTDESP